MLITPLEKITEDSSDEALWEGFLREDDIPFLWLVERYREQVGSFAWRRVRDLGVAEQVVLATFARLYEIRPRNTGRFRHLLFQQAHMLCVLAKEKLVKRTSEPTPAFGGGRPGTPEEAASRGEERWRLELGLGNIPEGHRACLLLYYAHQLDPAEVAQILDMRSHQIPGQLAYARRLLRDQLRMDT